VNVPTSSATLAHDGQPSDSGHGQQACDTGEQRSVAGDQDVGVGTGREHPIMTRGVDECTGVTQLVHQRVRHRLVDSGGDGAGDELLDRLPTVPAQQEPAKSGPGAADLYGSARADAELQ